MVSEEMALLPLPLGLVVKPKWPALEVCLAEKLTGSKCHHSVVLEMGGALARGQSNELGIPRRALPLACCVTWARNVTSLGLCFSSVRWVGSGVLVMGFWKGPGEVAHVQCWRCVWDKVHKTQREGFTPLLLLLPPKLQRGPAPTKGGRGQRGLPRWHPALGSDTPKFRLRQGLAACDMGKLLTLSVLFTAWLP